MENQYLVNNGGSIYFKSLALQNYEQAKAEWEALLADREARKNAVKAHGDELKQAWDEFSALTKKYHVMIVGRTLTKLKKESFTNSGYVSSPSLMAWYVVNDKIVKADPCNGKGENFDVAFKECEHHYNRAIEEAKEHGESLKAAIEYCIKNELEWTPERALAIAREHLVAKLEADMEGTTIDIDCCSECNEWTVGERRCSCGNRRMTLEAYGEFPDVSLWAEAY